MLKVITASCTAIVACEGRCTICERADIEGAARKKSRGERAGIISKVAVETMWRFEERKAPDRERQSMSITDINFFRGFNHFIVD